MKQIFADTFYWIALTNPRDNWHQRVLDLTATLDRILLGNDSAFLALREIEPKRWLVVVYREDKNDGFVITAFPTRRINSLNQRQQLWP